MTQSTAIKPIDEVRNALKQMEPQFKMALPSHISADKFQRVAVTVLQNSPDLLACDRQSLYSSIMRCAQDGLIPDGKEAALVKFGDKVQYMPMTQGILKKLRNSGELGTITAQIIYEHDAFDYHIDDEGEHIMHRPMLFGERGDALGAYALVKTKDGDIYIEAMTKAQIEQVRQASRAKNGPAWSQWWDEMARKTVIRRLSKRLPMSTDIEQVVQRDDEMYDLNPPPAVAAQAPEVEAKPAARQRGSRLSQVVDNQPEQQRQPQTIDNEPPAPPAPELFNDDDEGIPV